MTNNQENTYDICVVGGLGHVGLPLAILLSNAGKKVVSYDINPESIKTISDGKMPFLEKGAEEILNRVLNKTFFISDDKSVISKSHFVIVVIGTPVDEHLNPRFKVFMDFFNGILDQFTGDQHIIMRSTVYPGTTQKIKHYLESKGIQTRLSFCPERIAQGNAIDELKQLPQIISSFSEESLNEVRELFSLITDEIVVLSPLEAELAKLFTNVWRYMLFSISNQFYQIACQNDLDFYKIYEAITYKYPRTQGLPKAGFSAGPCLFKDTMQLASFSNNTFFMGHAAMLINEGMPNLIVQRLKEKHSIEEKTVGILGMAFKGNSDDKRESLSYKLKKLLEIEAKRVVCSDIYIEENDFVSTEKLIEESDIIVLGTPHREYRDVVIPEGKIVADIWDFYGNGGLF